MRIGNAIGYGQYTTDYLCISVAVI